MEVRLLTIRLSVRLDRHWTRKPRVLCSTCNLELYPYYVISFVPFICGRLALKHSECEASSGFHSPRQHMKTKIQHSNRSGATEGSRRPANLKVRAYYSATTTRRSDRRATWPLECPCRPVDPYRLLMLARR